MSTDLEHDLRAAFDELAATTTISTAPRFGDVTARPIAAPRRGRVMALAAAAVVLGLVGGLALLVRDRTGEAPAPAATTAPAAEPAFFLFPDEASGLRFNDPRDAVDAYLADRVTTSPPGQTVTYRVNQDGPPFNAVNDRALIGFSLTVTPDDPALCCDSGDGVAAVQQVDGAWFVSSAQTLGIVIDVLRYTDDGVVEGAYRGTAGGLYTAEIDDFGYPGPEETGVAGEQQPDPEPGNNAQFRSPGHTAPAVGVRFWHSPTDRWPSPRALFAEFIVPRGATVDASFPIDTAVDGSDTSTDDLVAVPPLVGLTEAQARDALDERGLAAAFITSAVEPGAQLDGTVAAQDPPAGQIVTAGTTITVTVASAG